MSKQVIVILKTLVHTLLVAPFAWLAFIFQNGSLARNADPVEYITHFTGKWALWILLGSLAITPVRRLSMKLGFLVRFRRLVGLYAFFYATLHLATYVFLFSGYDLSAAIRGTLAAHPGELLTQWHLVWPTIWDDLKKRRFIQVGLFSWLLLFALASTSASSIMRCMGGRAWQRLHRLIYVAAIAAVIHFWWLVKSGDRTPVAVTAILAVLLLSRAARLFLKRRSTASTVATR